MPDLLQTDGLIKYEFTANVLTYPQAMSWHFISLPIEIAKEIRAMRKWEEEGWGRLKVTVKTGNSEWKTAIWFDTKHQTYLLPLKAEIRKKEKILLDQTIKIMISL